MSRFRVEHTFRGISVERYEQLYFDDAFNEALCKAVKLSREVVKRERTDERIHRIVKVGPEREIPKPVAKVLKTDRLDYEEHVRYTFGSLKGNWETIPSILAKKVNTAGTFSFADAGGNAVRRVVEGEITVKILGVGGVIERFIISDVEKSYDDAARFTQEWIDDVVAKESAVDA